jgi:hypothetical protein
MDELFSGKKFTVVEEVNLDEPRATPLGYKVKKGFRLVATDGTADIIVGKALLQQMHENYDAVEDMPQPKKRGRPRKEEVVVDTTQPIEQAEEWANRDLPDDASPITQAGPTYTNPNESQEA